MTTLETLFRHPLGPALVLALGGLLLRLSRAVRLRPVFFSQRDRSEHVFARLRGLFTALVILGAGADLVLLRVPPIQASLRWVWQPLTVAGSALDWRLDGWSWLAALLVLLLTATALLLREDGGASVSGQASVSDQTASSSRGDAERTLLLGAAALAFVFSGNVVTLASCWVILDAALAFQLRPGERVEPAGRAWGLLSLAGLLVFVVLALLGENGGRTLLMSGPFERVELGLLWVVALIRAGVYPLHYWLTSSGRIEATDRVALHLIVPTTGLWLLARVHEVAGPNWDSRPEWAALGALALLGTALVAWTTEDEGLRWRWIALNRASLVVMAAYVAVLAGPGALVWPLVTFSLGSGLLAVGQATRARWGWSLPTWLSALALWGLPGTPGFLARSVLIFPTGLPVALPLFGVILVAETLLVAALWQAAIGAELSESGHVHKQLPVLARSETGQSEKLLSDESLARPARPDWSTLARLGLATALLAAPLIAWGTAPAQLANLAGLHAGGAFPTLRWALANARRSVWIGLALSGLAGVGLGVMRRQIFAQMRGWQRGIVAVVSLEWLYQAIAGVVALAGAGLQYFAALGEGEGYLGWLMLTGLILWVLLRG